MSSKKKKKKKIEHEALFGLIISLWYVSDRKWKKCLCQYSKASIRDGLKVFDEIWVIAIIIINRIF